MSISPAVRSKVRERANFSCEYCGISETDAGGELTLDHFHPLSSNGSDDEDNLVYACYRCNIYKGEYWSDKPDQIRVFDPRTDDRDEHFWLSESGNLFALTESGEITIKLLRLNRSPLVAKRRQKYRQLEEQQVLWQTQKAVETLIRLSQQQRTLLKEQHELLDEQRRLLEFLFRK